MSDNLNRAADEFEDAVQGVSSEVGKMAERAAEGVSDVAEQGTDAVAGAADKLADAAGSAAETAEAAAEKAANSGKSAVDDIVEGVERVSSQVADSARHLWESEQRKEVQSSVVKGLSGLAVAIEEQTKKIAANPEAQKIATRVEEVADKVVEQVRTSKTLQDLAEGLMKGLTAMAASIEGWLQSHSEKQAGGEPGEPTSIEVTRSDAPPSAPAETPVLPPDDVQSIDIDKPQ